MLTPIGIKMSLSTSNSIRIEEWNKNQLDGVVHFHEACQLTYIIHGCGILTVGPYSYRFVAGETFLFGKNVPHRFVNHDDSAARKNKADDSVLLNLFFNQNAYECLFQKYPETTGIKILLEDSLLGLKWGRQSSLEIYSMLQDLRELSEFEMVVKWIDLMDLISSTEEYHHLMDEKFRSIDFDHEGIHKINEMIQYIRTHYHKKLTLAEIAAQYNMSQHTFCRFFKSRTQKTFSQFLIEARISKACDLLRYGKHTTTESCYDSGFMNVSNFQRHFKNIMGVTPTQYRADYVQN